MYRYPEIKGPSKAPHDRCIAFEKLDGSNMRFEWNPKRSWYKFGSRSQLIDKNYPILGQAIELFREEYADIMDVTFRREKKFRNIQGATAFAEFFGPNSFAGQHVEEDPKELVLFDLHIYKKGIMAPAEFVENFGFLRIPKIVYQGVLNESFIRDVRAGKYPVREGVVCKGGSGHKLWMRKVKTKAYLEKLKRAFGQNWKRYGE